MKTRKEKALDLILQGMALQFFIPLISAGFSIELDDGSPTLTLLLLCSFLVGYIFLIKGCRIYAQSKGYSSVLGWLGLLSILGVSVLVLLPTQQSSRSWQNEDETLPHDSFNKINIPEIFVFLISLSLVVALSLSIYVFAKSLDFEAFIDNSPVSGFLITLTMLAVFLLYLLKTLKNSGFKINYFLGKASKIDVKPILFLTLLTFAFNIGFHRLVLYHLSFTFPDYVEDYLNDLPFNTTLNMILIVFSGLLFPLIMMFFMIGIVLQKWSLKWGATRGIIALCFLSLIPSLFSFNHNIAGIILDQVMFSILYFKTCSLIAPFLLSLFSYTLGLGLRIIHFFSQSTAERNHFISIQDYQDWMQPLLGQHVLLVALSLPLLIYFIYKNFPRNDAMIPYYANEQNFPIDS